MLSAAQFHGHALRHDRVRDNTITDNQKLDIFYDRSGVDNHFHGNTCGTSQPAWIC